MNRVKFIQGQQRQFIDYALQNLKINLREFAERINVNYELIKKYHQEKCFIGKKIFLKICKLTKINPETLEVSYLEENWGQIIGGKLGIARMREKYTGKLKLWQEKGGKNHFK